MTVLPFEPEKDLRQWGLGWIRTAVPVAWGFVLAFLATRFPAIHGLLDNAHVYAVIEGAITLVWYGLFRAIEHRLPAWLTRFVLGANTAPIYPGQPTVVAGRFDEVR